MPDKSFADLLREAGVQPSGAIQYAQSLNRPVPYRSYTPPRPLPRRMRPADVRAYDDNAGVAQQAMGEMRRDRMTGQDAMLREAQGPASNQLADAGMVALETTGVPALRRSYDAFEAGDPRQGIYEGIWGGLGLAGTLGAIPGARRGAPRLPTREPVGGRTSIYRGINQEYDAERAALLGDRWWHTNPEVASSYAPGGEGAHVIPGTINENALRMAHIEAPPGTMYSSVPLESLPADIRRAFPRGATRATTHEVAAAAEAAGYDGVTFSGVRDSTFAGTDDGAYPGFGTGDEGRVVALFRDDAVGSPFGQATSAPVRLPTREPVLPQMREPPAPPPGSVLPVRPPQPFRQSLIGGADDLTGASRGVFSEGPPDGMPPRAPDAGSSGAGQSVADEFTYGPLYHGTRARFDNFDVSHTGENRLNFVADREIADRWAGNRMDRARGIEPQGRVIEAYARLRNPKIIQGDGSLQPDGLPYDQIEAARGAGHDGVILRNFDDAGEGVSDYTIVFDQNNVRVGRPQSPDGGSGLASNAGRGQTDPMHPAFVGMTREEFLGSPRITTNRNAADLKPKALTTVRDQPAQPFLGRYEVRMSEDGAAVYDGDRVIASYNFGDTLVVDPAYRRQGIAQELVYQWRTNYPGPAVARERTRASQAIQEQVWERIKNHPGNGGGGQGSGSPTSGPTAGPSRPPPDTAKSYRPGPPKGGFFFSRRR